MKIHQHGGDLLQDLPQGTDEIAQGVLNPQGQIAEEISLQKREATTMKRSLIIDVQNLQGLEAEERINTGMKGVQDHEAERISIGMIDVQVLGPVVEVTNTGMIDDQDHHDEGDRVHTQEIGKAANMMTEEGLVHVLQRHPTDPEEGHEMDVIAPSLTNVSESLV